MIDTLARHLAAVSEARRLVRMVLDNNPAFRAFEADGADLRAAHLLGNLGADRYFSAYCHLNDAIAALTLENTALAEPAPSLPLSERIAEITPATARPDSRCSALAQTSPAAAETAPATLQQRLRYVLDTPSEHAGVPSSWTQPRDEARVAIVRHSEPHALPPIPGRTPA